MEELQSGDAVIESVSEAHIGQVMNAHAPRSKTEVVNLSHPLLKGHCGPQLE
jgi:hypothetical protein